MTTENTNTKIIKEFIFSCYKGGRHITQGYLIDQGGEYPRASFAESLSPLEYMIEAFKLRPLGTKIRVTMEEIN